MPLTIEQLQAVKTIICHGPGCPDGIASAILLHDCLPEAAIQFIQYGTDEHANLPVVPGMLFADFSPPAARAAEFVAAGALVLDHHKTAKPVVDLFGDLGAFGDEKADPGVCGAVLVYRHVWEPILASRKIIGDKYNAQKFAEMAGIRDTWQTQDPRWEEAGVQAEMLRFYPVEHWLDMVRPFSFANQPVWEECRKVAGILVAKHVKSVKRTIEKAWRFTTKKGTRVICFEGTHLSSDAAEALGQENDIVVGFGFLVENSVQKMILSCRSHTGYDVEALAKHFGGGGHTAAAGFNHMVKWPDPNPYRLTEILVGIYEGEGNSTP